MKDRTVVLYVWNINYDADLTEALQRMTGVQDVCWTRRDLLGLRFQPQPEAAAGWDAEYRAAYARWQLEQVAGDTLNFLNQTTMKLTEAIDDAVRARLSRPDGVIVVHYGSHQPADIVTRSPADLRGYLNSGGFGWSGGLCWCSNDLPLEVYHLFAHEIAHAAYLRHCRRGKERFVPGWSHPNDHDHYDDNCMMSYSEYSTRLSWPEIPSPPLLQQEAEQLVRDLTGRDANWKRNAGRDMSIIQTQGNPYNVGADAEWANPIFTHTIFGDATHHYNADRFRPHFCGKCNFRLRGWDVAATLPYNVPPEPDVPHHDRIGQSPVLPWATDNAERPRAPLEIRYSSLKSQTVPTGYGAALWFSPDVQGFINPQINTSAQDRNFSWSEVNDQWAGLSCLNVGQQGEGQIVFLPHFKFNEFTDPIHEICHYFQEFNSNAQALYEGITEVLAALLSIRIQKRLRRDGHAALVERFHYAFNLSYAQATWFAFDCLIPRMGLANVAKMFTFDDHALLRAVLLDSARGEDLLVDAVRNLIKSDLEQSGRIRAESFGRWQSAKALFIPEPAVPPPHADPGVTLAIRTQVQAELEEARTSFCAWLEEMLAKVPAPGNAAKSSLATLDDSPERNYKIAKHLRIYSWVRYKETAKKQSEDFQHMHFKALQLDDDVQEKQNHITLLKRELHSAASLDSW